MTKTRASIIIVIGLCAAAFTLGGAFAQPHGQLNIVLGANRIVGEVIHLDDTHRVAHARAGIVRGSEAVYINGFRLCRGTDYNVDARPGHVILTRAGQHSDVIIVDYTRR